MQKEPKLLIGSDQKVGSRLFLFNVGIRHHKHCRGTDCIFTTRVIVMELGKPVFLPRPQYSNRLNRRRR